MTDNNRKGSSLKYLYLYVKMEVSALSIKRMCNARLKSSKIITPSVPLFVQNPSLLRISQKQTKNSTHVPRNSEGGILPGPSSCGLR